MKPIVSLLARRFLTGKKRNAFLSFISAISLFGVALGVAALVTVMAVMEGFEAKLRSLITGVNSHITLYSSQQVIRDHAQLAKRIERDFPEITASSPFILSEVMIAHNGKLSGSLIEGVDRPAAMRTTEILNQLSQGEFAPQPATKEAPAGIVLGSVLADNLGAKLGAVITAVSPYFDQGTLEPRQKRFVVTGILSTGMYEYDSKLSLIGLEEARAFFDLPFHSASGFRLKTSDPSTSIQVAGKIRQKLGVPYRSRDWTELNQNLLYAIKLQKVVIFIVLVAIIVVAAFNIMSTLVIMMDEKKREMAILKAIGLGPADSSRVFTIVGAIIGGAGALAGAALGLVLCQILSSTQFVQIPADVYYISYLPVDVRLSTLLFIIFCALLVALLATVYPSWRVAKESPIEGLRYE